MSLMQVSQNNPGAKNTKKIFNTVDSTDNHRKKFLILNPSDDFSAHPKSITKNP